MSLKKTQHPSRRIRSLKKRSNFEFFCENCGAKDPLEFFRSLPVPYEDLMLCERCADLPLSRIKRRSLSEMEGAKARETEK